MAEGCIGHGSPVPPRPMPNRMMPSYPVQALGCMADAGIEDVAGVKRAIVVHQGRLGVIKMPDVMFCWIFRTPLVQQLPHPVLKRKRVMAFRHDVVLVEDKAEEVGIVDPAQD